MHVLKPNWAETSVTAATSHRTRPSGGIETGCEAVVAARSRPVEDDKGPIEREPSRRALELVGLFRPLSANAGPAVQASISSLTLRPDRHEPRPPRMGLGPMRLPGPGGSVGVPVAVEHGLGPPTGSRGQGISSQFRGQVVVGKDP